MDRREFIGDGLRAGVAALAGRKLVAANGLGPYSPLVQGPEVTRFTDAEQRVLSRYRLSPEFRFVRTKSAGLPMRVLESGDGPPVLLLHGGGMFGASWAPLLAPLQQKYRLYAPDLPGCGLTYRINFRGLPFRATVESIVTDIMDALQLQKAEIIGSSMGGYFAMVFSLAHPERVEKLVLTGEPAGSKVQSQSEKKANCIAMTSPEHVSMADTQKIYIDIMVAHVDRVDPAMIEADNANCNIPWYVDSWNSMFDEISREEDLALTYGLRPELKNLKPNTLFIWGDKDHFGPPSEGLQMAALAPHARCEVVLDAGHALWFDEPERCAALTMEFLAS